MKAKQFFVRRSWWTAQESNLHLRTTAVLRYTSSPKHDAREPNTLSTFRLSRVAEGAGPALHHHECGCLTLRGCRRVSTTDPSRCSFITYKTPVFMPGWQMRALFHALTCTILPLHFPSLPQKHHTPGRHFHLRSPVCGSLRSLVQVRPNRGGHH